MNATVADRDAGPDALAHNALRLAVAVTAGFVVCEVMAWTPTFLGGVFATVLLGNLPFRPTLKMAVVIVLAMAAAATFVYLLSSALRGTPVVLFGAVGLCMFLSFYAVVSGVQALPFIFLIICLTVIPVMELVAPTSGSVIAETLPRGLLIGLIAVMLVWIIWPRNIVHPSSKTTRVTEVPHLLRALISTAVVLPVMLAYLLFGWSDVMPVLIGMVLIVLTFDPAAGRREAWGRITSNFLGGMLGFMLHAVLLTTPSIVFLALLLFVTLLGFAKFIQIGGPVGHNAVVGCNAMLIILSSAISSGPSSLSLWMVRLFQFVIAGAFAVGAMELLWHRVGMWWVRRQAQ